MIIGLEPEQPARLPPVVMEFIFQDGLRIAKSLQRWQHPQHGEIPIELYLPVADGIEVLLPDVTARKYVIKFMNMKAKRMLAAGFKPCLRDQMESAEALFAAQIEKNGMLKS